MKDIVLDIDNLVVGLGKTAGGQRIIDGISLQVREGLRGIKPLTDKDRADIRKTIDEKILRGQPISFR